MKKTGIIAAAALLISAAALPVTAAPVITTEDEVIYGKDLEATLLHITVSLDNTAVADRINEAIEDSIYEGQMEIMDFLRETIEEGVPYGPCTQEVSLADAYSTDHVLSLLASGQYYSGGVHGWGEYFFANCDLRSGEFLEFEDVLDENADTSELIGLVYDAWCEVPAVYESNAYSAEDLYDKAVRTVDEMDEQSWRAWTFCEEGLRISFIGGTEVAYAAGPVELIIPYGDLAGIIDPDYLPKYGAGTDDVKVIDNGGGSGDWNSISAQPDTADWNSIGGGNDSADWNSIQGSGESADWSTIENGGSYTWNDSTGGITAGTQQGGHHYEFIQTDMDWEKANADAVSRGGYLAVITSSQEQSLIEELMKSYPSVHTVWIGGRRGYNGKFIWVNNEDFIWTKWGNGEPNNETGDENYLDMYEANGSWVWNDVPNSISRYYAGKMGYILELEGGAH